MIDEYLFCRSCGVLCPQESHFEASSSNHDQASSDDESSSDEDVRQFVAAHETHGLDRATRSTTTAVYDRAVWDPMGTVWFEVACNRETFLVRASRTSIDTARCYELVPGSIQCGRSAVEFDEPYLRSALDRHFFPHLLRPTTIDQFVTLLRSLVGEMHCEDIETSFDDANDPTVGIAPLPDPLGDQILARCAEMFDEWEVERVASFVDTNRFEDGALALRVRQQPVVMAA